MTSDLIIRARQIVLPDEIVAGSIHIKDGRIARVASFEELTAGEVLEVDGDSIVMPGLVDTHVHINEPGRTSWEGFATATRAAAAGGVTTLIDMPLNSIPATTNVSAFTEKLEAARNQCFVDVGFWGGVVPGNTGDLKPLTEAGVVGFKCFLIHSGVDEFPNVTEQDLRDALPRLKELDALLIVHAEVPGPIEHQASCCAGQGSQSAATEYQTFLNSRPRAAENEAIELIVRLAREFGNRFHIVHHSSADALPLLKKARETGLRMTVETCPHYLAFAAEEIPDGATEFKCCPPIRERENREELWQALESGVIDMVVSDHSPCPAEMKLPATGDFMSAWGGISSVQLRLPVMWSEARKRGHSIQELVRWLCAEPADLVSLGQRKGRISVGSDADIVIWNPNEAVKITPAMIHHRHKLTPYSGRTVYGKIQKTFLRGQKIYDEGEFIGSPAGEFLLQSHLVNS